jgi:cytochrome c-type biogenesis protein CcmH/NrfG
MKKLTRKAIILLVVLTLIVGVLLGLFFYSRSSGQSILATRIVEMGPAGAPPATIEGLKAAIATYENRIEQQVKDVAQVGIYWKILATRLMDRKMYGEALKAIEKAVEFYPEDPSLQYMEGISAANLAKSIHNVGGSDQIIQREQLFKLAEEAYLRAIALDPTYSRPKYALAVLYVFELDKSEAAIPYLLDYLRLQSKDVDAMFVLARSYYTTNQGQKAVDVYDKILSLTKDPVKKTEAENNKKQILDGLYGR